MNTAKGVTAVIEVMASELGPSIKVGDHDFPDLSSLEPKDLTEPYVVGYEVDLGGSFEEAGYGGGQGMQWFRVQFSVKGLTARQVRDTSARIHSILCDRDPADSSAWLTDIPVDGHLIVNRKRSGVVPSDRAGSVTSGGAIASFLLQATG